MSKSVSLPKVASQFKLGFFSPWWEWDYLLGVSQPDGFIGEGKWEEEEAEEEDEEEEAAHAPLNCTKQGGCHQCVRLSHTHCVATPRSATRSLPISLPG